MARIDCFFFYSYFLGINICFRKFECRHQIIVQLFLSTNRGILDLEQVEECLYEQHKYKFLLPLLRDNPHLDAEEEEDEFSNIFAAYFQDALMKVIDELGIVL